MRRFLVILSSRHKIELEEPDEDAVLATLFKRGLLPAERATKVPIIPLNEEGQPLVPLDTDPDAGHKDTPLSPALPTQRLSCPLCGASMKIRKSVDGGPDYWGCRAFPWCKGKRELSADGSAATEMSERT